MSRTIRTTKRLTHKSKAKYIQDSVNSSKRSYYKIEHNYAWIENGEEEYNKRLAFHDKYIKDTTFSTSLSYAYKPRIQDYQKHTWYKVMLDDEEAYAKLEEDKAYYKKQYESISRDGTWAETSRNTGFKHACTSEIRRKSKALLQKIQTNYVDYDNICFPDNKNGKQKIWDFW